VGGWMGGWMGGWTGKGSEWGACVRRVRRKPLGRNDVAAPLAFYYVACRRGSRRWCVLGCLVTPVVTRKRWRRMADGAVSAAGLPKIINNYTKPNVRRGRRLFVLKECVVSKLMIDV
jgi:hypothetical protein